MTAGLVTPLHLAASLLALFAALGLAIVVLARPGGPSWRDPSRSGLDGRASELAVALGAVAFAAGQGLSGALVEGTGELVGWLRAGGLALIALGVSRRSVTDLRGAAVLMPVGPLPAAVVGAVAGGLAGLRALLGGRQTALVGAGLLAWGAAEALTQISPPASAAATTAGAVALGAWLWQASAQRLQAKFVTAFVASMLAVVVVIAGVLSEFGSTDLVREELRRLEDSSGRLAEQVESWPQEAIEAARPFRPAARQFQDLDDEQLATVYEAFFSTQDFFVFLDGEGATRHAYPEEVVSESLLLSVQRSDAVSELLDGAEGAGQLMTVAGRVVAVGGVQLSEGGPEGSLGALLTGRVVDGRWAAQAGPTDVELLVEIDGNASVVSGGLAETASEAVTALPSGGEAREALTFSDETWHAAASPVTNPGTGSQVARVVALSRADVIAQLARDQVQRLFLLALAAALFAGVVAAAVTGRLVAPIRRLTRTAERVREGELEAQTHIQSADEVGQLGRTFNAMTSSLAAQSWQLRDAASVQSRLRARLEALTSSMEDALVAVDADGKVITFNPAAERLVGRDVTDALGLPLDRVLEGRGPGDVPIPAALGDPQSTEVVAVQLLLETSDGQVVPTAATAAPVRDQEGEILGRVLVLRDVTREVEVERMKTEFLSNVSHELRTPLTPIKGYADVLAHRDVGPDATRRYAGEILASTDRLERIVGMIVDFAALDSGRLRLAQEPVAVSDLLNETVAEWRAVYRDREFRRRVADSVPPVLADQRMLRRCLDELIDNAVKFSPEGEPVSVTATEDSTSAMVRLSVRDRGVGIEPATAARIFSDFYQVDASETRSYGGLGLGLALVRRIVDGLGGTAAVESRGDRGSTFHLWLPAADAAARSTRQAEDGRRGPE